MKMRGTAQLTDELVIDVDKLEIGNVPGFLSDWLNPEDIRGDLTDQHLEHDYTLTLREGEARWTARPSQAVDRGSGESSLARNLMQVLQGPN